MAIMVMMEITTKTGVRLMPIPVSPNDDYMAGEDGLIYSRTKYKGFGKKELTDWYPLVGHKTAKGYRSVSLCHESVKVTKSAHRLVCMAFHGMPPTATTQVRHLDGNPSNNVPSNLCWGTQYENWQDRKAHGHGIEGEKHHAAKLTDSERDHLAWAIQVGLCSQRHAAKVLKMSQSSIGKIVERATSSG